MRTGMDAYAELHCHSNFSFLDGASHPEELVEEAARLGLAALALTDHDGFYGVVRFAEAAREVGLPTVFGAELTLDAPRRLPNGMADPPGEHLLVLAQGPVGHSRLARAISTAQLAGEKGAPRSSLTVLAEAARARLPQRRHDQPGERRVVRGHRLPQGHGAGRVAARRSARRRARGAGAGGRVRPRPCARRAVGSRRSARPAPQRCARADRVAHGRRGDRDEQRPLRDPRAPAVGDRTRGGARPPFARRDRRLAPGRAVRAPARAGRADAPVRALARCGRTDGRHRPGVRVRSQARGTRAPGLPGAGRAHGDDVAARAGAPGCGGVLPAHAQAVRPGDAPDRLRARRHRAARVPRVLLVAARHRRVLPPQRHLLPGSRQRGEQRGLLRDRRHQSGCGRARALVRTVPVTRTRRSPRHRPRHRAPAPRRGDPVRLRALRPRPRRAGGERHHLPAPFRAAGDGQGRGPPTRSGRRAGQVGEPLGRGPGSVRRTGLRPRRA